jgi:integrase/recombinase XerD
MPTHAQTSAARPPRTRWEGMERDELSLEDLRRLLLNAKRSKNKSRKTLIWYERGLDEYMGWLERSDLAPTLANFNLANVRSFMVDLQERCADAYHPVRQSQDRKLSDSSVDSYMRALRAMSNWLAEEGYSPSPVLARLKLPRLTKKVRDILSHEEISNIVASLNPRTEIGARDQAIFLLLLDSGMRLSAVYVQGSV